MEPMEISLQFVLVSAALWHSTSALTRVAIIGDYGSGDRREALVATMVNGWGPEAVITTGDNLYPWGLYKDGDKRVGNFYHSYMYPFKGKTCGEPECGSRDKKNRFWPAIGNHDWGNRCDGNLDGYFAYMPVDKRYYDVEIGDLHLFSMDADCNEERFKDGGLTYSSPQGQWLQMRMKNSTARWKLVVVHTPPYTSDKAHPSSVHMRWPYVQWGATAVLSGHAHNYERVLDEQGFPYFVNGAGGAGVTKFFDKPIEGSMVRYLKNPGAQLVEANSSSIVFKFFAAFKDQSILIDCYSITISPTNGTKINNDCRKRRRTTKRLRQSLSSGN